MIIQCDKCSTKFRLDDSRVTGGGVKVRCTKCQNVFIVAPPAPPPQIEEVQVEEVFAANGSPKKPDDIKARERAKAAANMNLKFDFSRPDEEAEGQEKVPAPKERPEEEDFSFSPENDGGEKEAPFLDGGEGNEPFSREEGFTVDEPPKTDKKDAGPDTEHSDDLDFSFDDIEKKEEPAKKPDEWDITGDDGPQEGKEEPQPVKQAAQPVVAAPQPAKAKEPAQPPKKEEEVKKDSFSELLSRSISEPREIPEIENREELRKEFSPKANPPKRGGAGLMIAVLVFIIGGVVIYFSGVIDTFARRIAGPRTAVQKTVEIEYINGKFPENKSFGRFFVIEARIKNVTESPQEIKAVTGVIYNDKGEKIATRSVSPGRMVSVDDLKNLSKEDILKSFKDPSGGSIPPKGTVPVMVPFIDLPPGLSEYGIDIVR
ncbi:MAG: zinc-ribbon domain-containing protein [Deltaproteobacteria bacterium]|nr:zinc-ribbon domain-containing protein [Deltaproteobacteria bacterium]